MKHLNRQPLVFAISRYDHHRSIAEVEGTAGLCMEEVLFVR